MRVYSFFMGITVGIYFAQNYDIPDIKNIGDKVVDYLKSIEKNK